MNYFKHDMVMVRKCTIIGMSAGLSAFFGVQLGGECLLSFFAGVPMFILYIQRSHARCFPCAACSTFKMEAPLQLERESQITLRFSCIHMDADKPPQVLPVATCFCSLASAVPESRRRR